MPEHPDIIRLRSEYADRENRLAVSDIYSLFNPSYLFTWQQRQRSLIRLLVKESIYTFDNKKILEIGCGSGRVLAEYLSLGANPGNLFGIDLLADRVSEAQQRLPGSWITCDDGQNTSFLDRSFDIIIQYTAFSSILDPGIKARVATEMLRLLNDMGYIIWYDFWLNPTNPQTKGIRPSEIIQLFPNCSYDFQRITLAPPIARRIVPLSWILATFLERIKLLNSHYLVLISKKSS